MGCNSGSHSGIGMSAGEPMGAEELAAAYRRQMAAPSGHPGRWAMLRSLGLTVLFLLALLAFPVLTIAGFLVWGVVVHLRGRRR